jgi:hypothetical protein
MKKFLTGKKPNLNQARANESGQLLVEAVVALGIIIVSIVGAVSLMSRSVNQSRLVADQVIAVNLAAEGIEVAKNILDGNVLKNKPWNEGFGPAIYGKVDYLSKNLGEKLNIGSNDFDNPETIYTRNDTVEFLHLDPKEGFYSYDVKFPETIFKRLIQIKKPTAGDYQIRVNAKVVWKSPQGLKSVFLTSDMLGWR